VRGDDGEIKETSDGIVFPPKPLLAESIDQRKARTRGRALLNR
jgi:hypothetical protein